MLDARNSYSNTLYLDDGIPSYLLVSHMRVTLKSTSFLKTLRKTMETAAKRYRKATGVWTKYT